jgi:hypothetical protein
LAIHPTTNGRRRRMHMVIITTTKDGNAADDHNLRSNSMMNLRVAQKAPTPWITGIVLIDVASDLERGREGAFKEYFRIAFWHGLEHFRTAFREHDWSSFF